MAACVCVISGLALVISKDMLHCVHQGVAPIAIASLVTHHYEDAVPGLTLEGLSQLLQTEAFSHYKDWCRNRRLPRSSSTFTCVKFGRESWQTYPELASCYKGAMVKHMIYWAATFLFECTRENDTPQSRLRAYTAFALAQFQFLQDCNGPWFTPETAEEVCYFGRTFLLLYQKSTVEGRAAFPSRKMYKLVPKFHSLLHMCLAVRSTRRNPRYEHLYMEEDYMKHISKICSRCHPSTMDKVCLFRYRAFLEFCS